jgi:transcription antitermination factor NusG
VYWACAQLEAHRERLALHCLGLAGFTTYLPRLRVKRLTRTRKMSVSMPALFPGYCFVWIELQWHSARWCPGVIRLVLDGIQLAKVPDGVIDGIRSRERDGLIDIAKPPQFVPGMRVQVLQGPLQNQIGLLTALRPHERVLVLLRLLGGQQRVELAQGAIAAIE